MQYLKYSYLYLPLVLLIIKTITMSKIDYSKELKPIALPLNEDIFWELVENSIQNSTNEDEQEAYLIKALEKLTPYEIIGFRLMTDKLLYDTYTSHMWCAGYIMNGGCSDDGFEYFRNWVISCGKEVYYKAKENPDTLIDVIKDGDEDFFEFESFWYVALQAFNNVTGLELYDYIDYENHLTREGKYPNFEFDWNDDEPETLQAICPQLYERCWY